MEIQKERVGRLRANPHTPLYSMLFFLYWLGSHFQKDKWLRIFLELINDMTSLIQKTQKLPCWLNQGKFISGHSVVKFPNIEDKRALKQSESKEFSYQGMIDAWTTEVTWRHNSIQTLKSKSAARWDLCALVHLSFRCKGEIKTFID